LTAREPITERRVRLYRLSRWLGVAAACLYVGGSDGGGRFNTDIVKVRLLAEDRSWHAWYLLPPQLGPPAEVSTGREVHVPLGARVHLLLASRDFISDFRISGLALRDFAIPNLPSEMSFQAQRPGRYEIRGDEMCGLPHTEKTRGWLIVEDAASYRAWMTKQLGEKK
jgi:heme/copper-type cytochrome/quinol oxidase subunit 2